MSLAKLLRNKTWGWSYRRRRNFAMAVRVCSIALLCVLLLSLVCFILGELNETSTLYEYYTAGGIHTGLEAKPLGFTLNQFPITIFSGAIHYFRVHPEYWRDRLRKLRACGLNAVETYVPWNLHNPAPDEFDFGHGSTDMSEFLDVVKFIQIAKEEDLLVLVRPGPYICAEWEFGGLPSWLLQDPDMKVRTSYEGYTAAVTRYYNKLMPLLTDLQFIKGGPVIAFQVENEYASFGASDKEYLRLVRSLMEENGIEGLFYTSDSVYNGDQGTLPDLLMTANFQDSPVENLNELKKLQPDKPFMVMEYWTGWFDHWTESHHSRPVEQYESVLEKILQFPASVNLYMFHGGTNWGFMNGANVQNNIPTYQPDVTSYDYDAPLSESGDYAPKYEATKQMVLKYNPIKTKLPEQPAETTKVKYPNTPLIGQLSLQDLVDRMPAVERVQAKQVTSMELLPINGGAGQSYGFVLYRKANVPINNASTLQVMGHIKDLAVVLLDGERKSEALVNTEQLKGFGYWEQRDAVLQLSSAPSKSQQLDILVENWGRNNFGQAQNFYQSKGIVSGPVLVDGVTLEDWDIYALQFKKAWLNSLEDWSPASGTPIQAPTLFRAELEVDEPHDTFLDMQQWSKGIVFVNGFALGRYFHLGPSRALFLPAPLLRQGTNEILVFELFSASNELVFSDKPLLG